MGSKLKIEEMNPEQLLEHTRKLEKSLSDAKSADKTYQETIADMQKTIEDLSANEGKKPSRELKHKKDTYILNAAKFQLPGESKRYTLQDLEEDQKLVERVLEINGQQILTLKK